MDLDKYLREQLKILDGKPAQYYGAVEKQQRRLYREIQDLLDNLQTDDAGNVLTNARNYGISEQINTRLQQAFYNEDYINAVDSFASGFDQSATLNKQWLTGVLGAELTPDITRTADLLIQRQKRNAVDLLVSTSAIDSSFFAPINNTLIESISTGESIKELNRNIRNTILGNDQYDGRLLSYSKQIANDTIATGDRNYMFEMSKNADIEFYRYSGGTISDTREFCQTRNGGYYHKKEIQDWGNPNKSPENWQGRYRGTNSVTIFTWCGGYNCRHSLIPVSAISVPKKWLAQAEEKGYYKPSKEISDETGLTVYKERKSLEFDLEKKTAEIDAMESSIRNGNWTNYKDALKRRKSQLKTAKIERDSIIDELDDVEKGLPPKQRIKNNSLRADAEQLRKTGVVRYTGNISTERRAREIEELTGLKVEPGDHQIFLKKDVPTLDPPTLKATTATTDGIGGVVKEKINIATQFGGDEIRANWDVYDKREIVKYNKALDTKIQVDTYSNKYPIIKEQELRIGKLKKEELIVFDQHGNILSRGKGETFNVLIPQRQLDGYGIPPGAIITHNHPGAIIRGNDPFGYGTSFSLNDIQVLTSNRGRELRAVTGNAVHVFKKRNNANFKPIEYDGIKNSWKRNDAKVREELQDLIWQKKLEPNEASYMHPHMVWERVALDFPEINYFRYIR